MRLPLWKTAIGSENRVRLRLKGPRDVLLWALFVMCAVVLYLDNPGNHRQFHSEETDKMDEEYEGDRDIPAYEELGPPPGLEYEENEVG